MLWPGASPRHEYRAPLDFGHRQMCGDATLVAWNVPVSQSVGIVAVSLVMDPTVTLYRPREQIRATMTARTSRFPLEVLLSALRFFDAARISTRI